MMSYSSSSRSKISLRIHLILHPCNWLFSFVKFTASSDMSIAVTSQFVNSNASVIAIQPVPVPTSKIFSLPLLPELSLIIWSISSSVSGLGINALWSHLNLRPKK